MAELKIAIGQSSGKLDGPEARLHWLKATLPALAAQAVNLFLLPELSLSGYNRAEKLIEWAEAADGSYAEQISELACKYQIAIHYGFPEKFEGHIYNSAQCLGPDGSVLNLHRKLILPPGFESDHFMAGEGCQIYNFAGFKIATLICYDAEFPETFRNVSTRGAQLVLVPTALGAQWDVVAHNVIPTRAFENGIYVAYANHAESEGDMVYLGNSCIISPNGTEMARAGHKEEIIIATLTTKDVDQAQARLPYHSDLKLIKL